MLGIVVKYGLGDLTLLNRSCQECRVV